MHQKTENRPIGGLDSDSENRVIADTDYRYAMNIRNSIGYDGQFGVLTNVKGNVLIFLMMISMTIFMLVIFYVMLSKS